MTDSIPCTHIDTRGLNVTGVSARKRARRWCLSGGFEAWLLQQLKRGVVPSRRLAGNNPGGA